MATVNVLNQMAEYDFNAPINVEMIFEDSDNDDPPLQSSLCEQQDLNDNNNNNKQVPDEKSDSNSKKHNEISQNQINNKSLNKPMLRLNKNSRILQNLRNPSKEIRQENDVRNLNTSKNAEKINNPPDIERNQNIFDANSHGLVFDNNTINSEERLPDIRQMNDHQEPATYIEDLLNKLSEHIFLIMQSFHHYGIKTPNNDNKKREEVFNFIKYHFYELSYSTVESIFLPQEQNESFINKFIDNTVLIVNKKSLQWKCSRRHVLPFFKELMTWTKQKRESIQNNPPPNTSNENILLKQQLVRPLLPLNRPQSEIDVNTNGASKKIDVNSNGASKKIAANSNGASQNNLCIFSSGPPGKEISINIDVNTLNQINERQQLTVKEAEQNRINNKFAQSCESIRRKTPVASPTVKEAEQNRINNKFAQSCESTRRKPPVASPTYRHRVKHTQKNNSQFDRPAPPPYHATHNSRISYGPQQYSHSHIGQPHQNPSIGQHNYPTQVHYIDTNHTSPSPVLKKYFYDNTNNNIPVHRTQIENQGTSNPVMSNVSSLDPNTRMLMFRCYMCGKRTTAPCNPYNPPCRLYFCSYLCQELDSQFYKPSWGNT